MKVKVTKVKQSIGSFYIAKIPGVKLYQMAKSDITAIPKIKTDVSDDENDLSNDTNSLYCGTQRNLIESKVKSIEEYLNSYDATFPSSIILNVKSEYILNRTEDEIEFIEDGKTFTIIDGQHRLQGFRDISSLDFDLIVSIFIDLTEDQISRIFTTINSQQTKVGASLSLYLETNDKLYTPRKVVAEIGLAFNTDNKSPWKGKIKLLGTKDNYSTDGIISLSSFAKPILDYIYPDKDFNLIRNRLASSRNELNSIKDILAQMSYNDYILWAFYANQNHMAIYKILFNFFKAFEQTFEEDWGNNKSFLTKSAGYIAMMRLFGDLFVIGSIDKKVDFGFFYGYINRLKALDGKINSVYYNATGLSGANALYKEFKKMAL